MTTIHPSAQVDPAARLGEGVSVGPFCVVGPDVSLNARVVLHSHVVVVGRTTVGQGTEIFSFAAIGHRPQDLKYAGEQTTLTIGAECIIREGVTIHPGTTAGGAATVIGDRCALLAQAHVGHDCRLGNDIVLSNNVMLAGHVRVGDHVIFGGGSAAHQFVRVGEMAFVGGLSGLEGDLIPYGMAVGDRARLVGLNLVGLRRHGFARDSARALKRAMETVFAEVGTLDARVAQAIESSNDAAVAKLCAFVRARGHRPLCRPAP